MNNAKNHVDYSSTGRAVNWLDRSIWSTYTIQSNPDVVLDAALCAMNNTPNNDENADILRAIESVARKVAAKIGMPEEWFAVLSTGSAALALDYFWALYYKHLTFNVPAYRTEDRFAIYQATGRVHLPAQLRRRVRRALARH